MRSGEQQSKIEIIKRRALEAGAVIAVGGTALTMAGCSNVEAQSPEVTTTTTAEQTPDEIITITPSPSPEVTPTDIPEYTVDNDGTDTEITQSPEAGEVDPSSIEYMDTKPYREKTPYELSVLPATEKEALYQAIIHEGLGREDFEEFSEAYYSFNNEFTHPDKPSVAPAPASLESTPEEISEHNAQRIRYVAVFDNDSAYFDRDQMLALTLYHGVNSPSYSLLQSFYSQIPNGGRGMTIAANESMPLAGKVTSAGEVNMVGVSPSIELTGPNGKGGEMITSTYAYVENEYQTKTGQTVKVGDWMIL